MAKKYYAVKKGKKPGIYNSWTETKKQVDGYSGAQYKSFTTYNEALNYVKEEKKTIDYNDSDTIIAYTDGSFDKASKRYSYGAVLIKKKEIVAQLSNSDNDEKYSNSFQIAGECFGCLNAIKWAKQNGYKRVVVHYDYMGIEKWAKKEWRTNKAISKDYVYYYDRLSKAIDVEFVKVKAHSGVEMNELADQLAKDALK